MYQRILSSQLINRIGHSHVEGSSFRLIVFSMIILLSFVYPICPTQAQTSGSSDSRQLTGHENHKVTLKYAATLTQNYRKSLAYQESSVKGEFFGKDGLLAALGQHDCIGLRLYYGKKDDGTPVLVFVGVDQGGRDMTFGFIGEEGMICPPICPEENSLTSPEVPVVGSNSEPDASQEK